MQTYMDRGRRHKTGQTKTHTQPDRGTTQEDRQRERETRADDQGEGETKKKTQMTGASKHHMYPQKGVRANGCVPNIPIKGTSDTLVKKHSSPKE